MLEIWLLKTKIWFWRYYTRIHLQVGTFDAAAVTAYDPNQARVDANHSLLYPSKNTIGYQTPRVYRYYYFFNIYFLLLLFFFFILLYIFNLLTSYLPALVRRAWNTTLCYCLFLLCIWWIQNFNLSYASPTFKDPCLLVGGVLLLLRAAAVLLRSSFLGLLCGLLRLLEVFHPRQGLAALQHCAVVLEPAHNVRTSQSGLSLQPTVFLRRWPLGPTEHLATWILLDGFVRWVRGSASCKG